MTESLALALGNLKNLDDQSKDDLTEDDQDPRSSNLPSKDKGNRGNNKKGPPASNNQGKDQDDDNTKSLMTIAKDILANLVNHGANKESSASSLENAWAFKAVKLASSASKDQAATSITAELLEVSKTSEKHSRDQIEYYIIDCQQANFRIDKTMAMNIRVFNVFC
jgi:hypothetical protein